MRSFTTVLSHNRDAPQRVTGCHPLVARLAHSSRYDHVSPLATVASEFHLHIGAGKLGLALCVPAIANAGLKGGPPMAVFNRPGPAWLPLLEADEERRGGDESSRPTRVALEVNNEHVMTLHLVVRMTKKACNLSVTVVPASIALRFGPCY